MVASCTTSMGKKELTVFNTEVGWPLSLDFGDVEYRYSMRCESNFIKYCSFRRNTADGASIFSLFQASI